jgi:nucleoside-diphosphate-sugar epimerase
MILVTGGTGLIGAHLLYKLACENSTIRATRRSGSDLDAVRRVFGYYSEDASDLFDRIEWVEADITDISSLDQAFADVKQVYHSAALISFDPRDYKKLRRVNIEGTANIVHLCVSHSIEKLCYVSSVAAIGRQPGQEVSTEETDWNPEYANHGYAITKYGAELEVWRASQEGVPVVMVNPGVVLGPGYWYQGSGSLFGQVKKGLHFYSEGVTGFVGVDDVAAVMMSLMKSSIQNERYILVAENLSFKEVFTQIAVGLGKKPPSIKITDQLAQLLWRVEAIRTFFTRGTPLITRHSAKTLNSRRLFSSEKVKGDLRMEFESIKQVIERTCKLFLRELKQ